MTAINGHAASSASAKTEVISEAALATATLGASTGNHFTQEQIKEAVAELEIPFDPGVIEWRVTNTTKVNGYPRGQVIPYADQRAYTDRLNALFTPAGWTRRYTVHTSANFQRSQDEKVVAKVFVTCEVLIFGLGSHSATGEEWADDDNAGTSAEAQAFKRACSCFGLGRYLYYFSGTWMDLDERKRLKTIPKLGGWATPEGWRQGLRPDRATEQPSSKPAGNSETRAENQSGNGRNVVPCGQAALVRQIESMAKPLGRGIYRGFLKSIARAWNPSQIQDVTLLQKVLIHMQSAERGLRRVDIALNKAGFEALAEILHSLNVASLDRVDSLDILRKIVIAIEAKAALV